MGDVKLNSSGGGSVTLTPPSTASNYTVTLPAATSTLIDTTSTQTLTNKTLTAAGSNTVEATSGPTSTQLAGQRNKIINGAMMIDQRNAGASVTPTVSNTYTLDRWTMYIAQSSKLSVQQNAGSATPPAGFSNYLGITSLSAYSVGTSDYFFLVQNVEGFNVVDLSWGTANAAAVSLSFYVQSSLTGTFSGGVREPNGTALYPFQYTISSANTWQRITVNIPAATVGTWVKTNASSIQIIFNLGAGATYSGGTAGAWTTSAAIYAASGQSVVGTNGATFYITGVQLEKGATATPFENRLYGAELALCQRYYYKGILSGGGCTNGSSGSYPAVAYPTQMRTAPTIGWVSGGRIGNGSTDTPITGLAGTIGVGEANAAIQVSHGPAFTVGNGIIMYNTPVFTLSAEL